MSARAKERASKGGRGERPATNVRPGTRLGVIVGGTKAGFEGGADAAFFLDCVDLDRNPGGAPARIPLDFLAHGLATHPDRPHLAALLEKRGPGACLVDLVARRVVQRIAPLDGHHFYGHGAYARDGKVLFAVETDLATDDGKISVRDAQTFAPLGVFPSYGKSPHDCLLIDEGRTLAITNGGGEVGTADLPCVAFVDVTTRRLLERFVVSNPEINTGHIAITRRYREFAVVSAPRDGLPEETCLGGLSMRSRGAAMTQVTEPKAVTQRFLGESLSVCIHEPTRTVAATHPRGGLVTFWNLDDRRLVASIDVVSPRGVTLTLDGAHYAISCGKDASLVLLRADPLGQVEGHLPGTGRFGGSHVYAWAPPAQ